MQQVITNLLIGQVELRSEDSPDILPYSHERRVEKLVVPLGEELAAIQKAYIQVSHFYHNLGWFFFKLLIILAVLDVPVGLGFSLVAASRGCSHRGGFWLQHTGSRCTSFSSCGFWALGHRPSGCGTRDFPDQGWSLCPLCWRAESLPPSHQGSPRVLINELIM